MVQRPSRLVAHTPSPGSDAWHYLDEHSLEVARLAAEFAEPFGGQEVARWLGLLHDAGKAHPEFQDYLWQCYLNPKHRQLVDHKSAGAFLLQNAKDLPQVLLGHHGGLSDLGDANARVRDVNLHHKDRMERAWAQFQALGIDFPSPPSQTPAWAKASKLSHEFYVRMLFSCLVDADWLDTEQHGTPDTSVIRKLESPPLVELFAAFETSHAALMHEVAAANLAGSPVNRIRAEVYASCLKHAAGQPGFYRLTVPTGGGKTRASTAFALRHAIEHGQRRVIYALPFLTITDQTVDVLRKSLQTERAVLEHHSGIEPPKGDDEGAANPEDRWRQLASENWDAPVIVTTTVQLFESLLARKTTRCRKLHNIARSVIVLDEFQAIPANMRAPIFDVLKELVTSYGVSVVLCTATQPVLDTIEQELDALEMRVTELAPDPAGAFATLERVRYEWPEPDECWTWEQVAGEMRSASQVLTIVNTVANAAELFRELADDDAIHLSTRLCGAHRREVLAEIRRRLAAGETCRVVSTQLVEAGVDLDFPVVMRAIGPLDRIAQAAGRCNREGRLPEKGRVVVFSLGEDTMPPGAYKTGAGETRVMLAEGELDLHKPETFDRYFRRLYANQHSDEFHIQELRAERAYKLVDEHFRMIDDDTIPVLVTGYSEAAGRARDQLVNAAQWAKGGLRDGYRAIQPFVVACRYYEKGSFEQKGLIEEILPGLWEWKGNYDRKLGLPRATSESAADNRIKPAALMW